MKDEKNPVGEAWNFDKDNRGKFGKAGPGSIPAALSFQPDALTQGVIQLIETRFRDHPGKVESFDLPVTRHDALQLQKIFRPDSRRTRGSGTGYIEHEPCGIEARQKRPKNYHAQNCPRSKERD